MFSDAVKLLILFDRFIIYCFMLIAEKWQNQKWVWLKSDESLAVHQLILQSSNIVSILYSSLIN